MPIYWKRINYLLKYQVYLRVLPVVFLAVLLVGSFSWIVFDRQATRAAVSNQHNQLQALTRSLSDRIIVEAVSWEIARTAPGDAQSLLAGAGLIESAAEPCPSGPWLGTAARGERGRRLTYILDRWLADNWLYFSPDFTPASWRGVRAPGGPVDLYGDARHRLYVFPPLALDATADPAAAARSSEVWVPVLVRRLSGSSHSLLMLDLRALLTGACSADAWCVLDEDGLPLAVSPRFATAGLVPAILPEAMPDGNGLAAVGPSEISALLGSNSTLPAGFIAGDRDDWLIAAQPARNLPWHTVTARPAGQLRGMVLRYFAAILIAALLALVGATWSITRLMSGVTRRLHGMAENMEALARGEFSQRLPEGRPDEIGCLEGYFNMMAGNLDEAHRQVKDQAAHLRAALENMRLLDRAKDDFLVLISHEVRTPLTAITGGVTYLRSRIEKLPEQYADVVASLNIGEITDIIESSSERLTGFMNDAIQMTSFQTNERRLELAPVRVDHMVEVGLCGIRERARKRGITVANELESVETWSVLCDLEVMKAAFEKILDNAVTHNIERGEIRIGEARGVPGVGDATMLPTTESVGRLLQQPAYEQWNKLELRWRLIEIHNTGPAMSAAEQAALFGKFELTGRIENHKQGSGLSLPIAKTAVEQHGGRMFVHSDEFSGNSLFVLLPTLAGCPEVEADLSADVWDDVGEGVGGTAWNENVGEMADGTPFKIELDDCCSTGPSGLDEPGGGIDGAGGADHEEDVALSNGRP